MNLLRALLALLLALPFPAAAQSVRVAPIAPLQSAVGGQPGAAAPADSGPGGSGWAPQGPSAAGIDWRYTPAQIGQIYQTALGRYEATVNQVVALPAESRTFANTVKALEDAGAELAEALWPATFLGAVSPDKAVRDAAEDVEQRAGEYFNAQAMRQDLYKAYQEYAAKGEKLEGEEAKLLEDALDGFKKSGIDQPEERRQELKAIRDRLNVLSQEFARNLQENTDALEVTQDDLAGLPATYIESLAQTDDGKYRIGLDEPTYVPFMRYSERPDLREKLDKLYNDRAAERNVPLLEEALTLRSRLAKLLGFENFAALAIEDRMAKTPERVQAFLTRLAGLIAGRARDDDAMLLERKRKDDPAAERVESYERHYYATKLRQELYQVDQEKIREYFPVDRVVQGTLDLYQELLGVVFTEKSADAWHEDVRLFEITDAKSGETLGYFYLDLHPRPGKYEHQAAFTIIGGRDLENGGRSYPVSAMVGNLGKPAPGRPALLSHGEVETFFHEFGHIMHQTLTKARFASYAGSSTALDFVEAPSQMMENFVWRPEVVARLSGHYRNPEEKLPPELLAKMNAAREFGKGMFYLAQIALASLDLAYHTMEPPVNTTQVLFDLWRRLGTSLPPEGTHFQATFGHLMGGYGAGYYGYLWSEVFAQDIFSRFEKEGVLNPAVGMAYRKAVLEKGSTVDEEDMLRGFLGREPSEDEFLKGLGVDPAKPSS